MVGPSGEVSTRDLSRARPCKPRNGRNEGGTGLSVITQEHGIGRGHQPTAAGKKASVSGTARKGGPYRSARVRYSWTTPANNKFEGERTNDEPFTCQGSARPKRLYEPAAGAKRTYSDTAVGRKITNRTSKPKTYQRMRPAAEKRKKDFCVSLEKGTKHTSVTGKTNPSRLWPQEVGNLRGKQDRRGGDQALSPEKHRPRLGDSRTTVTPHVERCRHPLGHTKPRKKQKRAQPRGKWRTAHAPALGESCRGKGKHSLKGLDVPRTWRQTGTRQEGTHQGQREKLLPAFCRGGKSGGTDWGNGAYERKQSCLDGGRKGR